MGSDALKRKLIFSFIVITLASAIVKRFITKALEYKTILNFNTVCIAMHFLVMSPCSHDFLLMSLYIYSNIIIMVVDYYSSLTYECLVFR